MIRHLTSPSSDSSRQACYRTANSKCKSREQHCAPPVCNPHNSPRDAHPFGFASLPAARLIAPSGHSLFFFLVILCTVWNEFGKPRESCFYSPLFVQTNQDFSLEYDSRWMLEKHLLSHSPAFFPTRLHGQNAPGLRLEACIIARDTRIASDRVAASSTKIDFPKPRATGWNSSASAGDSPRRGRSVEQVRRERTACHALRKCLTFRAWCITTREIHASAPTLNVR